jgi:hypothetical protein
MSRFAAPNTLMALALACVLAPACLPVTATVPVTPANSAQVSSCETLGTEHNLFVIGGTSFGIAGSTLAGVGAAVPNGSGKTDLGYTAMAVAGAAAILAGLTGYTSSQYASDLCPLVTSPPLSATAADGGAQ